MASEGDKKLDEISKGPKESLFRIYSGFQKVCVPGQLLSILFRIVRFFYLQRGCNHKGNRDGTSVTELTFLQGGFE
ncbi:hypothetical protein CHM34_05630 [Paludifilum halophilum]|uniref:Uncharacterized protein n=1 Tax=Paludifilum halophilum TaxID=1642702 RepID=A0A235B8X1_9BACL|nr:hypothetical protein CHM34_05630 [Paludifilum halophilum]